ncbi:MAG: ATP-dependent DNA helicase RecG [Oscillospiraceae bacterium]|jgi:ATP-dependent DNA helicase RecG|nr:ATP-dependent DNA helicase RecG [Oscillospiraceae bacterium]
MSVFDTGVRYIKGVGEGRAKLMEKLGVRTLGELVRYFPRAYEDRTVFKRVQELMPGDTVCVRAAVTQPELYHVRRGLDTIRLSAADDTGILRIVFFNQTFIRDRMAPGETYIFYGKVTGTARRPEMQNPVFEPESESGRGMHTGAIVPVYALTAGISQKIMSNAVRQGLLLCGDKLPDPLPPSVRERHCLAQARFSYNNIHFPSDLDALELARKRLIFEELFILAAAMKIMRGRRSAKAGRVLHAEGCEEFFAALPFELTGAQKRAIHEAARDMASGVAMNRLIQGDVGSGKTAVAAACCYLAWKSGCQSALMAPTELLAEQHYSSLAAMFEPLGMRAGLLTGGMTAKKRRDALSKIALGEIDVAIGTHALISDSVTFLDLALVITDEQHRFGVRQRSELTAKGECAHVLVMSATPIPRTLALMIYGDLDVSVIDELPPGRQRVETFAVGEKYRTRVYEFTRALTGRGRQAYVVCPAVEDSEDEVPGLVSAVEYSEKLAAEVFPDRRVALVHGRMKTKEKDAVMKAFRAGEIDILVATTVIEVGVDVPNAVLMIVENADRFGLSQLHQLRGRVGRGEHKSYCILFEGAGGAAARERLDVLCRHGDGFEVAKRDLALRGPGDFFGSRQHGLPELKIASLLSDMDILTTAQDAARETLEDDPELRKPENAALSASIHEMLNQAAAGGGGLS